MPAEGSGGSDTSLCQPRSRAAVGCSGPGGHNGAAVAQSTESDLSACATVPGIVLAKSGTQPQLPRPFLHPEGCSSAIPVSLGSREMSQAFVALEPLELLTQTVQERLWCPCSCLLLGQCFLELLFVCYQVEEVFLRCCALKFATELNTKTPKESFSWDHGSSKSRQGCASGLAGRLGFPCSLQH